MHVSWTWQKFYAGCASSAITFFAPITPIIIWTLVFICIDFVLGISAGRRKAKMNNKVWHFESKLAWRTLEKITYVSMGIIMCFALETRVLQFEVVHLAQLFAGFVCGVELWSFFENAAYLSDSSVFLWARKFVANKVKDKYDIDLSDTNKEKK